MNTEIQATFIPLMALTGAQKSKTVTIESGTAAYCIKGILLPRGFLLRSLIEAISGSVTASKIRLAAVIKPKIVKKPKMIRPGFINCVAPASISLWVGR